MSLMPRLLKDQDLLNKRSLKSSKPSISLTPMEEDPLTPNVRPFLLRT